MKKLLVSVLLFGFVFVLNLSAGNASAQEVKVGIIKVSEIFDKYQRRTDMQKAIDDKYKHIKQSLKAELQQIIDAEESLKAAVQDGMSEESDIYIEKRQEIEKRKLAYKQSFARVAFKLEQLKRDAMDGIREDIAAAVAHYAEMHGFTLVLRDTEKSVGENNGTVIYFKDSMNITAKIIELLDQKWAAYKLTGEYTKAELAKDTTTLIKVYKYKK